jgi:hypothetical protein
MAGSSGETKGVLMSQIQTARRSGAGARTALQVTAFLSTLGVLFQGATAGQIFSGSGAAEGVHGGGAIAFHVVSAFMTISAAMLWWATRGSIWPTAISALVFLIGLLQAYLGDLGVLSVHVPLALALTIGTAWVLTWSCLGGRTARHSA